MDASFIDLLNARVDWSAINRKDLARRAGVSYDFVRELSRGRINSPSIDNAKAVLDALGLNLSDLYENDTLADEEEARNYISIPRYKALLSAGHGAVNDMYEELIDHIPFTSDFLRKKLQRSSTRGLVVCEIKGESMMPTIGHGDLVMIDMNTTMEAAGLYALNYEDQTIVKRVERISGGYSLISDNPIYPCIQVQASDLDTLYIIGKILWISRTL